MSDGDDDDDFMIEDDVVDQGDDYDDDEDYGFEYEDDDEEGQDGEMVGAAVDQENQYYAAKELRQEDPQQALLEFTQLAQSSQSQDVQSEWQFKGLKQQIKMLIKLHHFTPQLLQAYQKMLHQSDASRHVSKNQAEKSVNSLLDLVINQSAADLAFMEQFYQLTLDHYQSHANAGEAEQRLVVKTLLKLAKVWLDRKQMARLGAVLQQLHQLCPDVNGKQQQ